MTDDEIDQFCTLLKKMIVSARAAQTEIDGIIAGEKKRSASQVPPCPHEKIVDLWHDCCPHLPRVRSWTGQRPRILQRAWIQHPDLEWWKGFFTYIAESRFLSGKTPAKPDSAPFIADLEWVIRPANLQKIIEGKYHRV